MRHLLLFLLIAVPLVSHADCTLLKEKDGQKLFNCRFPGTEKDLKVLDLKGGFTNTAFYHGYFLRNEIEHGVLNGVQTRLQRAYSELSKKDQEQLLLIKKCVVNNYRSSVSDEFKEGLRQQYRGLQQAGSKLAWNIFEESNYMVEFSIFTDSMQRKLEAHPTKTSLQVFSSCAPYFVGKTLAKPFKVLAQGLRSIKMGCTGISASASSSTDGALVHGRNFDTGLLGFYENDQVIVINRQSNGMTSVGIGSAGLHYAGGISGFNNFGLAVSLHELQTEGTKISYPAGTSDIAPYLLHSVLMKAKTLNQAIALIQERKGFGAWTFFISDSKTDEAASIELSGDTVVVARRTKNGVMAQTNHFIAPATKAEGYEYSLNKTLETRARFAHVTRTGNKDFKNIDAAWVIDRLSGHEDELVGPRAFGRTTTKVYTAATHVMIPARQEWWMSLASTYPTNRSAFVGLQLGEGTSPIKFLGTRFATEDEAKPNWYSSMNYYVQSYLNLEQNKKSVPNLEKTLLLLDQAHAVASQDQVFEFTYNFMWARIQVYKVARLIMQQKNLEAREALNEALARFQDIRRSGITLHDYERFQLDLWSFRAESLKSQKIQDRSQLLQYRVAAKDRLKELIKSYPQQRELYDLQWSLGESNQLYIVLDAEIRLGTIE